MTVFIIAVSLGLIALVYYIKEGQVIKMQARLSRSNQHITNLESQLDYYRERVQELSATTIEKNREINRHERTIGMLINHLGEEKLNEEA